MFSLTEEEQYERRLDRLDAEKHEVMQERDELRLEVVRLRALLEEQSTGEETK